MKLRTFIYMIRGCQKATHNLTAGKLHKTGTAFVTLGKLPIQKLETTFRHSIYICNLFIV